jgi:uncharacterized membrane protein
MTAQPGQPLSCGSIYGPAAARPILHLAATGAGSTAGWLAFASGVLLGALAIVAAVVIAWRQRVIQLRDRAADRDLESARQREHQADKERIAQREVWRAEYDAIRKLLECGEELAYRVRNDGPYTAAGFNTLDVATFRMNAERLADRGVERLRDPLLRLASTAATLTQSAVPDQAALMRAYAQDEVPKDMQLHVVQRQAILQDRTARDLTEQIASTWHALRTEWGS